MNHEVAMTADVSASASTHLLHHYQENVWQEDLCFALWRPSTGRSRRTGLIYNVLLPEEGERSLHGNASFQPGYLARSIRRAMSDGSGLAFMHSHPGKGWQGMSQTDVIAERDVLAYPAGATGLPLLGMTIGSDGYWSARFWEKRNGEMAREQCVKVRVVGADNCQVYFDDRIEPPPSRKEVLRRTFDTWGPSAQSNISRLKVGIVGLGSVGSIVAEAIARIGVSKVVLIDPDRVEEHNLDRLLYASEADVGKLKVDLAERKIRRHGTSERIQVTALPMSVHERSAYEAAVDCDVLFSCVDRPVGRDVLNFIAYAHLIPVIDGGVAVETQKDYLHSAHWRAHIVGPGRQCMRCNGQYNTSMVVTELDGSLDDPSYITTLPAEEGVGNQNVFPFSLSLASMEVNLMLHYLLALEWWPRVQQQDYQFTLGSMRSVRGECRPNCEIEKRLALGDLTALHYLRDRELPDPKPILPEQRSSIRSEWGRRLNRLVARLKR